MALINLDEFEVLKDGAQFGGVFRLSNSSVVLCQCILSTLQNFGLWSNSDNSDLTPANIDDIDYWVSLALYELSTSMLGIVLPFASSITPTGLLLCDGSQYAREDYPGLYDILDSAFIVDSDYFVVPDLQDKFIFGEGANNRGDSGGSNSVSLSVSNLPAHNHTDSYPTVGIVLNGELVPASVYVPPALPTVTGNTGSGTAFDNRPAFLVLGFGIVSGKP
jgi:hypothetical protein